jgi:hypothetical protein
MDRRYWGTDWFFDDKGILRFPMTVPPGSAVQIGEPIPFHVQAECELADGEYEIVDELDQEITGRHP